MFYLVATRRRRVAFGGAEVGPEVLDAVEARLAGVEGRQCAVLRLRRHSRAVVRGGRNSSRRDSSALLGGEGPGEGRVGAAVAVRGARLATAVLELVQKRALPTRPPPRLIVVLVVERQVDRLPDLPLLRRLLRLLLRRLFRRLLLDTDRLVVARLEGLRLVVVLFFFRRRLFVVVFLRRRFVVVVLAFVLLLLVRQLGEVDDGGFLLLFRWLGAFGDGGFDAGVFGGVEADGAADEAPLDDLVVGEAEFHVVRSQNRRPRRRCLRVQLRF
mmetsp:Transcript_21360/g.65908  ORF Transcript_21360/g.65908 Transcript_21360/m.65908 type:complete len:271 (-) Transcript_21360:637-1449(-)